MRPPPWSTIAGLPRKNSVISSPNKRNRREYVDPCAGFVVFRRVWNMVATTLFHIFCAPPQKPFPGTHVDRTFLLLCLVAACLCGEC